MKKRSTNKPSAYESQFISHWHLALAPDVHKKTSECVWRENGGIDNKMVVHGSRNTSKIMVPLSFTQGLVDDQQRVDPYQDTITYQVVCFTQVNQK